MATRFLTWLASLAFPRSFRHHHGDALIQTLLEDCRTPKGRVSFWRAAAACPEIVRAGLAERMIARRSALMGTRRSMTEAIWQDVRHGARHLRRHPGFTVVALAALALGIGTNTALFQLIEAVTLRPLPLAAPAELAEIRIAAADADVARGNFSMWRAVTTNAIWKEIRDRQQAFSGVFAWTTGTMRLEDYGERRFVRALLVSGEFFDVLGLSPAAGRLLSPADDTRLCGAPAVVLAHDFWQRQFGGDRGVIGTTLELGRGPFSVAGVAPAGFTGLQVGRRFDVIVPLCADRLPAGANSRLDSGVDWFLVVMGRLKPDWSVDRASTHLAAISPGVFDASLPTNYPAESVASYRKFRLRAISTATGISPLREAYSAALWTLQITAALVLLVGCANLANLMLARATIRQREIAARLALGASRGDILRVVFSESLLLAVLGALLGLGLSYGLSQALIRYLDGGSDEMFLALAPNWRILAFTSSIAVLTAVLAGLAPAWRAAALSPDAALRGTGRSHTDERSRVGLRQLLMVCQVALSLVLVAAALLFTRSLGRLMLQDVGITPEGLTVAYVDMRGAQVPAADLAAFRRGVVKDALRSPGIVAAAETSLVPLSGGGSNNDVWMDDAPGKRAVSYFADVGADYFATVKTPVLAGRAFDDDRDLPGSPAVAVVNEAFVRAFLDGANPVGKRVWRQARAGIAETAYDIVGLVKDAKYRHLREAFTPTIFLAASQEPHPVSFMQLLVRTSLPGRQAETALREAFRRAHPAIVPTFQNYNQMVGRSLTQDRLLAGLSLFFGLLAMLLATLGLYGSMSFAVSRRTREIGMRIALGATPASILRLVFREAVILIAAGSVAGAVLVTAIARFARALVYQIEPADPATLLGATVLLAAVALVAGFLPARRAARLQPTEALRTE